MLLTLTTYQNGEYSILQKGFDVTIEDSFIFLKEGWDKLSKILRKYIPDLSYIWLIEPHSSGYPHLHIVIFSSISEILQEKIRLLWSQKYAAGSKLHGVDFVTRTPEEDIDSLRNYLMKYIAKGFVTVSTKFKGNGWTKEELVFYSLVWQHGFRTFQPSRKLQNLMAWKKEKKDSTWWYKGQSEIENLGVNERERYVIWEQHKIPDWLPWR